MIVASFFAPRLKDKWGGCDYIALLHLLDASCKRFDLEHMVISDRELPGLNTMICALPENLMLAILDGQRQFLEWAQGPVLLVGADCLILRDPRPILGGDITITIGPFADCPMNTGAIWCAKGPRCAPIWSKAIASGPTNWGDDQTSLYAAVLSSGLDVRSVLAQEHNWAPNDEFDPAGTPTVAHFRGPRKAWMAAWSERFITRTPSNFMPLP
jgi:hypothetical protein